jgi:hypothetical protein
MSDLNILLNHVGSINEEQVKVIERPIPKEKIKQRDAGFGKKLSYVSGHEVVNLLNEAFNYRWTFRVLSKEVVKSLPKWNKKTKEYEDQPPYIEVLGQLIIPDLGIVKEQFGTKALLGGESEQEGASKAAATDALKKCATLVGIALELYDEDESKPVTGTTEYKPHPTPPVIDWEEADVIKTKELKAILGINENSQLDPYVREFLNNKNATVKDVTPLNVKEFNKFLQKKAEEV